MRDIWINAFGEFLSSAIFLLRVPISLSGEVFALDTEQAWNAGDRRRVDA
jgi:hypothetical protein